MTPQEQVAALERQLLEALVARLDAEERIKSIRNVLAGIPIGQSLAQPTDSEAGRGANEPG